MDHPLRRATGGVTAGPPTSAQDAAPRLALRARSALALRRRRDQVFGLRMFGDPVWDLLLHLAAHDGAPDACSLAQACAATGVPEPTGQRALDVLVATGLAEVGLPPTDPAGSIALTGTGRALLAQVLVDPV